MNTVPLNVLIDAVAALDMLRKDCRQRAENVSAQDQQTQVPTTQE